MTREYYTMSASRALAAALDYDVREIFGRTPEGLHFTRSGTPDRRYKNWRDAAAYLEKKIKERSDYISKRML